MASAAAHGAVAPGFFSTLRIIGQIFDGYIVCESPDTLLVIDQHAAHERVTFERLRAAYADGGVGRQRLLIPTVVDVGAQAAPLVREHLAALEALGFELEPFGHDVILARAVPALLADEDPASLVRGLAEELRSGALAAGEGGPVVPASVRLVEAADRVFASLACHAARRAGDVLASAEQRALIEALDAIPWAPTCPHGRPVAVPFPLAEIERRFGRRA
jgi:DNA mismatch repair protein MutL